MGRLKRIYTDEDRANVYVALAVNNGNIRRTSRDTSVPEATIRDWRNRWESGEEPIPEMVEKIATEFIDDAERVRDKGLRELEKRIDAGKIAPAQLVAAIGVLDDKIRLGKGLATSRSETVHTLPQPEEMANALAEYMRKAIEKSKEREQDIIEVGDWEEVKQPALTAAE